MRVERATQQHDLELKAFYSQFELPLTPVLKVQRPKSFFDLYKLQSTDYKTFILLDDKDKIQGCATFVMREALLESKVIKMAYATDLRVAPQREAIQAWAHHFLPLTESLLEHDDCSVMLSVLLGDDRAVNNTLVRSRSKRRKIPIYNLIRKFNLVLVHGHLPLMYSQVPSLKISHATEEDLAPLADYLKKKQSSRALSFNYSTELLNYRFHNWPGFNIRSFILARDSQKNIVGCVAPFQLSQVQSYSVSKYSGLSLTTKRLAKFVSWTGFTNRLQNENEEFRLEFLTHLAANNPDVVTILLQEAYRLRSPQSSLVYTHFHDHAALTPPKGFLYSTIPGAMYGVTTGNQSLSPELTHSPSQRPPELEACLI